MNKCEINPKTIQYTDISHMNKPSLFSSPRHRLAKILRSFQDSPLAMERNGPKRWMVILNEIVQPRPAIGQAWAKFHALPTRMATTPSGRIKPKVIHGNPIPRSEVFRLNMVNIGKWM